MHFNKSRLALSAVVLFSLCLIPPALMAAKSKPAHEPNIVFILTDDERLEDIKHMPLLQSLLVNEGMTFENYFSNVSLCCPSRTSILRGQFSHNTGVMTNTPPNGGFEVAHSRGIENSTISVWLQEHGYYTALIGKYLNGYPSNLGNSYIPPGWSYWASAIDNKAYSEYNYTLNENGKLVSYGNKPEDYGTDVYLRKAVGVIKDCSASKKPFFIYLAFYAPHSPATPAPRHMQLFPNEKIPRTKAFNEADVSTKPQFVQAMRPMTDEQIAEADAYYCKRLRSLQAVDEAIETVVKTLKENGQLDNTYIAFASDNGFHLGEHRLRRGKQTAYETDIHLPLIVRGPGVAHASKSTELTGNIDLAPTFAELAGAKVPEFVDGRSLAEVLRGKSQKDWREAFLVEHWLPQAGGRGIRRRQGRQLNTTGLPAVPSREFQSSGPTSLDAVYRSDNTEPADPVLYDDKDRMQLAQEYQENGSEVKQAETDALPGASPQAARRGQRARRRAAGNAGAGNLRKIPEYHALRHSDRSFVEYTTGEREYYMLESDPDQIKNLATPNSENKQIESEAREAQALSKSSGKNARDLEKH